MHGLAIVPSVIAAVAIGLTSWSASLAAAPTDARAVLTREDARHLLTRTGFGAHPTEVARIAGMDRGGAVERLLATTPSGAAGPLRHVASRPLPDWVEQPFVSPRGLRGLSDEARREALRAEQERLFDLRAWWLGEMIATDAPLVERMTLFWHNHFVSSHQKVRSAQLMGRQNALLRAHALGSFAEMLAFVARDPAMVIYLDSATNRAGKPNENFARELMELFTLGEGHYTEADVREAARAFTGWSIDPEDGTFRFRPAIHDGGEKTVLGRSGRMSGDDVIAILLAHPATAERIVAKLWREFVSLDPDAAEVRRIARLFRDSRYEIRVALREIMLSQAFWSDEHRAALIKSPVDLVVGTVRSLGFEVPDAAPLVLATAQLGQALFAPPNVKGWPGGEAWVNSASLLGRKQFIERILRADAQGGAMRASMRTPPRRMGEDVRARVADAVTAIRFDSEQWMQALRASGEPSPEAALLRTARVGGATPVAGASLPSAELRALLLDASYQVK